MAVSHHGSEGKHVSDNNGGSNRTLMGIFAYCGPLLIISYVSAKDDAFIKFHIKQGLVLLSIEVGVWILGMIIWALMPLLTLIDLAALVFAIIGIMNVLNGKEEPLPFVGAYSRYFNF